MQRIGILDLGSNSAKLLIMHIYKNGAFNLIYTQKTSLKLGARINAEGFFSKDAVEDTVEAIKKFVHMCKLFKVTKLIGVATAAMRSAKNSNDIVKKVKKATDLDLTIIAGEQEAYYGYLGVVNSIAEKDAILFDLGGGSTEIILVREGKPVDMVSIPIGTSNMTEDYMTSDVMSSKAFRRLSMLVRQKLNRALPWLKDSGLPIIGVGGTVRNVAKMHQRRIEYLYPKLHNYRMQIKDFDEIFNLLRNTNNEQRKKVAGLNTERIETILAGITIINCLISTTKSKELIISGNGLREGLFYDFYFEQLNKENVLEDILGFSVDNLVRFTLGSNSHSQKVVKMAEKMFIGWQELHGLGEYELKILKIASSLHDIGISINYYDHPKHSGYLIENAPLMGLTHQEQVMAALVANWHNGVSAKHLRSGLYQDFLKEKDIKNAKKLALILAMAENLDFTETDAIVDVYPELQEDGQAVLNIVSEEIDDIEISELKTTLKWFKKEFKSELLIKKVDKKD